MRLTRPRNCTDSARQACDVQVQRPPWLCSHHPTHLTQYFVVTYGISVPSSNLVFFFKDLFLLRLQLLRLPTPGLGQHASSAATSSLSCHEVARLSAHELCGESTGVEARDALVLLAGLI